MRKIVGAILFCLANISTSQAGYIEYKFTVTAPFVHGSETIGGSSDPVELLFRVDANATNLSVSPTDGVYPINDWGFGGYGTVSVGGVTTNLQGGLIHISNTSSGDGYLATVNGPDDGTRINGRSLFVSYAHLFDSSGSMFNGIEMPTTDDFSSYAHFGFFRLTFRPALDDPEYLQNDYVSFDVFPVSQDDFTLTVRTVPEPSTSLLMLAASLGLVAARVGRKTST